MRNIICYKTNPVNDNHRYISSNSSNSCDFRPGPRIYNIVNDSQCRQGEPGTKINVSNFYALMPGDNSATIAPGAPIEFPNDGVTNNTVITRITATRFNLATVGIYEIFFQVSISEAGQLVVVVNDTELPYTCIGRATGTTQISCMTIINTTLPDSILSINNVAANATALTVTPNAGGNNPVSANLIVKQYY